MSRPANQEVLERENPHENAQHTHKKKKKNSCGLFWILVGKEPVAVSLCVCSGSVYN